MSSASGPSSTPLGKAFGKYVVQRLIAEGGMATVFEARHSKLGHRVAVKLLSRELRDKPDLVARFEREARAAARLESPHVCRVLDIDTSDDGRPYIVMEYLEGRDLEALIRYRAPIPWPESVVYIIEACAAVAVAHRAGIVHRDLKPANLFLADEGPRKIVKILDFGISKVTEGTDVSSTSTQTMLGTPLYMSPEQVRSARDVDGRADIWSLGVILYELISGQPPFLRENASGVIAAIVQDPYVPIRQIRREVPQGLADAIARALEKSPDARFQRVEDFAAALLPHAPAWFQPPAIATSGGGRGALPAQLTTSLADSMDNERTIADPGMMPDAHEAAPQSTRPVFAPSQPMPPPGFAQPPMMVPEASGPSAVARTTAGGRKAGGRGIVLAAVAIGMLVASLIFIALMYFRGRAEQSATPPPASPSIAPSSPPITPSVTPDPPPSAPPSASAAPSSAPLTARHGTLAVISSSGYCTVRVDGVEKGTTPISALELAGGAHNVSCTPPGAATKRQTVTIVAGQTTKLKF